MTKQCSCTQPKPECHTCKPKHPEPVVCYTCTKPLYDIITYYDICDPCFSVVINGCHKAIDGFILTFVDECGYPICFDDYESYMSVEVAETPCPDLISSDNKIYYTYTEQANNCMALNTALWTFRYPTTSTLKLSFQLSHCYAGRIRMCINMFYAQCKHPEPYLEPVIRNAIQSDISMACVKDPCYPGYVGWMMSLKECCGDSSTSTDTTGGYPHGK